LSLPLPLLLLQHETQFGASLRRRSLGGRFAVTGGTLTLKHQNAGLKVTKLLSQCIYLSNTLSEHNDDCFRVNSKHATHVQTVWMCLSF